MANVYTPRLTSARLAVLVLTAAVILNFAGCSANRGGPAAAEYYYLNPHKDLTAAGRVAVVELDNDSMYPQISTEMTEALFQSVQKRQLFGISIVRQNDPAYRRLQLAAGPPYSLEQLASMRQELGCNAILVGTVTTYQPYPHMSIGLELRLLDLADGQLLWALDQIWDTTDKATEHRITSYYNAQMRSSTAGLREQLVSVSSLRFVKFVAYEIAETLQSQQ